MSIGKSSPVLGLLLLLVAIIALAIFFSASTPHSDLAQVQSSPSPFTPQPTSEPLGTVSSTSTSQSTQSPTQPSIRVTIIPAPTGSPPVYIQRYPLGPTFAALQAYMDYVYREQPGTVIAQSTSMTPIPFGISTAISLTGYIVTEVVMDRTVTRDVAVPGPERGTLQKQTRTFDRVWRVTVTGGPFLVSSMGWDVWLDNNVAGGGYQHSNSVTAIVFDRGLLQEGARIGLRLGRGEPTYLPETLHLGPP
jgi:hypothetical protein